MVKTIIIIVVLFVVFNFISTSYRDYEKNLPSSLPPSVGSGAPLEPVPLKTESVSRNSHCSPEDFDKMKHLSEPEIARECEIITANTTSDTTSETTTNAQEKKIVSKIDYTDVKLAILDSRNAEGKTIQFVAKYYSLKNDSRGPFMRITVAKDEKGEDWDMWGVYFHPSFNSQVYNLVQGQPLVLTCRIEEIGYSKSCALIEFYEQNAWETLGENEDFTVYIDSENIHKNSGKVSSWILFDYKTIQTGLNGSFLSLMNHAEYDCIEEKTRKRSSLNFSGHMGLGNSIGGFSGATEWEKVRPGSVAAIAFEKSCAKSLEPVM